MDVRLVMRGRESVPARNDVSSNTIVGAAEAQWVGLGVPRARQVGRALMNIVTNAADWSPRSGVLEIRYQLERSPRESLVLTVCDEGPGFDEQALEHATEWLYRGDASRHYEGVSASDSSRHHGMGLAMARMAVADIGGSLTIGNRSDGKGARVQATLPLVATDSAWAPGPR